MGYPSTPYPLKVAEAGVKRLYVEFATTTNGAVGTIVRQKGLLTTSTPITRASAGRYNLFLSDSWMALLAADGKPLNATYTAAKGLGFRIVARTLTGASPLIVVEFIAAAGTAADVDDGASVLIWLDLKDSTV